MTMAKTKKLRKPVDISRNKFRSKKWDEIVAGRNFRPCDIPIIKTLCYWYEIQDRCMADLEYDGELRVAYSNDLGDVREMPQVGTMKKASAEIRALNKQLGIDDEVAEAETQPKETMLYVIQQKRLSKAAHSA